MKNVKYYEKATGIRNTNYHPKHTEEKVFLMGI